MKARSQSQLARKAKPLLSPELLAEVGKAAACASFEVSSPLFENLPKKRGEEVQPLAPLLDPEALPAGLSGQHGAGHNAAIIPSRLVSGRLARSASQAWAFSSERKGTLTVSLYN